MEQRRYGRTGHLSSVAILGGAAFSRNVSPAEAEAGFALAMERGVNHLDIAPAYGDAERLIGPLLEPVRDRWFVGCKTGRASADGARAQLEESLQRLRIDRFDLYQLHGVTDLAELDRRSGAAEVMLAARDEGLTTYVGITGHDLGAPRAHLEAVRRFDLDSVLFPIYPRVWADPVYRADAMELLAECQRRDVGVMVIKAGARQPWAGEAPDRNTWYRPYTDLASLTRGVRFALSIPGVCGFCTPGDLALLPTVLDAAEAAGAAGPMSPEEQEAAMAAMGDEALIFPLAEHAVLRR
ncbi:MAG: aldo/keto reductase [Acidimicrobiales bacterium]